MNPVIGQIIVISVLAVIVFFCGRSMLRNIRAELRGEGSCAGCPGCSGCSKSGADCCACMQQMEKLRQLKEAEKCKASHQQAG